MAGTFVLGVNIPKRQGSESQRPLCIGYRRAGTVGDGVTRYNQVSWLPEGRYRGGRSYQVQSGELATGGQVPWRTELPGTIR